MKNTNSKVHQEETAALAASAASVAAGTSLPAAALPALPTLKLPALKLGVDVHAQAYVVVR